MIRPPALPSPRLRRRSRRRRTARTGRSAAAIDAKKLAIVITITSRLITWVSSWASTPSSSPGSSSCSSRVVAQTVADFGERPIAKAFGIGVSISAEPRLGQVGLRRTGVR